MRNDSNRRFLFDFFKIYKLDNISLVKKKGGIFKMKIRIIILGCFLFCILQIISLAQHELRKDKYRTGTRPATPTEQEFISQNTRGELPTAKSFREKFKRDIPSAHKNITYLPRIRSQLLNNCGAFAPTYYLKTWQEAKEHGWVRPDPWVDPEHVMSPGFTYPLGNAGIDNGANIGHIMAIMCRYGCATWKDMPENVNYTLYPNEAQWRGAMKFRGSYVLPPFNYSNDEELETIKAHLAGGDLLCASLPLYKDPFENYPYLWEGDYPTVSRGVIFNHGDNEFIGTGPHAFTLIGYDDNKEYVDNEIPKKGAFLAVNSWGESWGVWDDDLGTTSAVWFAYEYFKTGFPQVQEVVGMVDRIGYEPKDVAILDLSHSARDELKIKIYAGNKLNPPLLPLEAFPTAGSLNPFKGRIVLDVTDFISIAPCAYWLKIQDQFYEGINTGEIQFFQIQKTSDPTTFTAEMVPFQTIDANETDFYQYLYAGMFNQNTDAFAEIANNAFKAGWADLNRDGWLDIALAGSGEFPSNTILTKIYQNRNGVFYPMTTGIPDFSYGNLALSDFNNDESVDLAICGSTNDSSYTKLYQYLGHGSFYDIGASLPTFGEGGCLAWGDYDNDGDVDLALSGSPTSGKATSFYRNDNGTFTDSGVNLPQMPFAQISWADLDNDGDLDLIVGNEIFNNLGDGTFRSANYFAIESFNSAHVVGDFNNDGLPDIIASGKKWDGSNLPATIYYKNDGNFFFNEQTNTGLPNLMLASLSAADFNNDGKLDVALCGLTGISTSFKSAQIFQQLGNGSFVDGGIDIPGLSGGNIAWADFDRDGDLDFLASGLLPSSEGIKGFTKLYVNNRADLTGSRAINQKPTAPSGLNVVQGADKNEIIFPWNSSTDDKTPSNLLQYNLRVGTAPGMSDIISPQNQVKLLGNNGINRADTNKPCVILKNMPAGRYFWAVQAQDAGLETSEWSAEMVGVISAGGIINPDVNNDGKLDAADLVKYHLMLQQNPGNPMMDMNGDGQINILDPYHIASLILGNEGKGFCTTAESVIGPDGGKIQGFDFEMNVPAGAFTAANKINLEVSVTEMPFGPDAMPLSYKLTGLPQTFEKPLTLRIKDTRPDKTTAPFIAMSEQSFIIGYGDVGPGYRMEEAPKSLDGFAEIQIPTRPASKRTGKMDVSQSTNAEDNAIILSLMKEPCAKEEMTVQVPSHRGDIPFKVVVSGMLWHKPRFAAIMQIATEAMTYYNSIGFDIGSRDWNQFPLYIYTSMVTDGYAKVFQLSGEYLPGFTSFGDGSYASIYVTINSKLVWDSIYGNMMEMLRATVAHETFHVAQNLYDPRDFASRKKQCPEYLWFMEACSTWAEWKYVKSPASWMPDVCEGNFRLLMDGFGKTRNIANSKYIQNYGYAFPALVQYLVDKNGGDATIVSNFYSNINAGDDSYNALVKIAGDSVSNEWYPKALEYNILGKLPGLTNKPPNHFIENARLRRPEQAILGFISTHVPTTEREFSVDFTAGFKIPELGASVCVFDPRKVDSLIQNDHKLAFKLVAYKNILSLDISRYSLKPGFVDAIAVPDVVTYYPNDHEWRAIIPDVKQSISDGYQYASLVTNRDYSEPHGDQVIIQYYGALIRDFLNEPLSTFDYIPPGNTGWPDFACSGKVTALSAAYVDNQLYDMGRGDSSELVYLECWGKPPDPVVISYSCDLRESSYKETYGDGSYDLWTSDGISFYRLVRYKIGKPWEPWDVISKVDSPVGSFSLPFDLINAQTYYVLEAHYKYTWTYYNAPLDLTIVKNYTRMFAPVAFMMTRK